MKKYKIKILIEKLYFINTFFYQVQLNIYNRMLEPKKYTIINKKSYNNIFKLQQSNYIIQIQLYYTNLIQLYYMNPIILNNNLKIFAF